MSPVDRDSAPADVDDGNDGGGGRGSSVLSCMLI